ncbi:DUF6884 domain-containing protein [Rhodococcus sp. NCIMB 12038]|uniref:DUF6884 domain-containing protein n=1 Tax=Rhodococcus sp. NCIMB 12038 TaxID=933800 RepID=UPI000B554E0B|nr:DUF6884 domain-containing protein [Rhodococcus sp. NCIMB 12038]OUS97388.1 hypothetical protein CA951_03320 [Rhodococcus sp. NCIMB 12038]
MPPIYTPTYRYDDATLTPPAPGRELIMKIGLVQSLPGIGPKIGGRYIGVPRAIGPLNTRLWRPDDGVEMTLPNEQVMPWTSSFGTFAITARGIHPLSAEPGWEWLNWTVADHLAHDAATAGACNPLVVVPCGAAKERTPAPAARLYRSTYFRLGLNAANALTGPESVRILSARHGLLPLHTVIEPYNLRLGQPGSVTAGQLRVQAAGQGLLDRRDVVLFGGRDYVDLARQIWPHALTPLTGSAGIGEQQQRLAAIAAAGHLN